MTPERWRQVDVLFQEARELGPSERDAYLSVACATDDELRRSVESLLQAEAKMAGFLARSTTEAPFLGGALDDEQEPAEGQMFGPYRLVRKIGSGGMGLVWLAERADGQYEKRVALKVIKPGLGGGPILRRFHEERRLLARLEHPNIAGLLDAGITADGVPYLVMEYIEGLPIDEYCDEHKLTIGERLRLFVCVCSAVQHAHQHLITHRDLKPANILVTAEGVPKLVDFGIAKPLDAAGLALPSGTTAAGLRLLTPEYASPEQVRGEPLSSATDVYSLGVVLYELLSGRRPYCIATRQPHEIERVVCEVVPDRPSTAIGRIESVDGGDTALRTTAGQAVSAARRSTPQRLRRLLSGDLDTIVLAALQKDPGRRYPSVERFGRDIQRHLNGLPITARKDTFRYRTGKFVRRHKLPAALATTALLVLAAGAVGTTALYLRAKSESETAQRTAGFLEHTFRLMHTDQGGPLVPIRKLLDDAVKRIDREFDHEPEVAANLRQMVARGYYSIEAYDESLGQFESALAAAIRVHGQSHPLVASLHRQMGDVFYTLRRDDQAERCYRDALGAYRRMTDAECFELGDVLGQLGMIGLRRRDFSAAEPLLEEAHATLERQYGRDAPGPARIATRLALLRMEQGRLEEADALATRAVTTLRSQGDLHDNSLTQALNTLADVRLRQRRPDEAVALRREVLEAYRQKFGENSAWVTDELDALGRALRDAGKATDAEALFRQVLERRRGHTTHADRRQHMTAVSHAEPLNDRGPHAE